MPDVAKDQGDSRPIRPFSYFKGALAIGAIGASIIFGPRIIDRVIDSAYRHIDSDPDIQTWLEQKIREGYTEYRTMFNQGWRLGNENKPAPFEEYRENAKKDPRRLKTVLREYYMDRLGNK